GVMDTGAGVDGAPLAEPSAAETVRSIEAEGGRAVAADVSVTDRAGVRTLFADTVARLGSLDVVVNAAGFLRFQPAGEASEDDWASVLDVHLGGYVTVLARRCRSWRRPATAGSSA
ncbi:MAG: SDR family oxidoreductase, partial [Pseudonocardia sp.]|nr:SDR family oxidoreductase [Pseudonocardia sp.]